MIVVGVMSGTSMDGLDVAVADLALDGDAITLRPCGALSLPWPPPLRDRLLAVLPPAPTTVGELCALDTEIGRATAGAVAQAIAATTGSAELVASHGQTVFHWVEAGAALGTLQLGQPAWIVEVTGLPVVSDLRSRDIAAGGQGAPLASTLDALWLADDHSGPRAALNLGGIANATVVAGPAEPVLAFDTGPANCLLDVVAGRLTGTPCDVDGRLARRGRVRPDLLDRLLAEPYYRLPPPKSTGRELFDADHVDRAVDGLRALSGEDLMATLTELTAVTVADALAPHGVVEVVASGGGVRNPAVMDAVRARLHPVPVTTSDARGLPADDKEAYLMALLGFLTWHQIPGVAPGATGARAPRVLGRINPGDSPLQLPPAAPAARRLVVVP